MELTEEMIDGPRYFFTGLDMGIQTLEHMREHMDMLGADISCWPKWAKEENGHITKAGKAIIVWYMMMAKALP